jgi:hypothetical protein
MRRKPNASEVIPTGRWKAPEAQKVLARWRASGLSATAFARVNGLANPQRLCWWRKRLAESDAEALAPLTFIPAVVTGAGAAAGTIVRLPGGVALEVTDVTAVPTSWIAALAAELKRQS